MSASGPPLASSVTVAEAPSDIGWQGLGPVIACTVLAVIVVMLRWYIRLSLTRRVGLEDYLITVALVAFLDAGMIVYYKVR
jgi:hypothetical protein